MVLQSQLNQTALHAQHVGLGAKMVDFAGWDMPLQYTRVLKEHEAVRKAAGLFDISHMGLVVVSSPAMETTTRFLDYLFPQDMSRLVPGKAVYTQLLKDNGGMIDDVIVYRLPESLSSTFGAFNQYLVIINASNREPDIAWMKDQASQSAPDVNVSLVSDRYGLLALQGPKALDVLEKFGIGADSVPKRFWVNELTLANVPVLVARTGYTGEDGVELIVPIEHVSTVWGELLCQGEPLGLQPAGLAARDILRLEAGLPLYGHELSLNETPLEAGLGWSVKLEKASDFIGKDVLVGQKQSGLPKRLIGFVLRKKTIPRQHDALVLNGQIIGEVTSGSVSPVLDQSIGMGYVNGTVVVEAGTVIEVEVRGQRIEAEIVKLPFYKAQAVPTK